MCLDNHNLFPSLISNKYNAHPRLFFMSLWLRSKWNPSCLQAFGTKRFGWNISHLSLIDGHREMIFSREIICEEKKISFRIKSMQLFVSPISFGLLCDMFPFSTFTTSKYFQWGRNARLLVVFVLLLFFFLFWFVFVLVCFCFVFLIKFPFFRTHTRGSPHSPSP